MKRYEIKDLRGQRDILLISTTKFFEDKNRNWNVLFKMVCDGYFFNFYIDQGKYMMDFLEKENKHFEGNKEEMQSYISYIFE